MRRILSVFLTLSILIAVVPAVYGEDILPRQDHMEISCLELEQLAYDQETFQANIDNIISLCSDKANLEEVRKKLGEVRDLYLLLLTRMELASIASYRDVTDQEASAEYMMYLEYYYEADELLGTLVGGVLDSPCEDALDRQDSVFSGYLWGGGGYEEPDLALYYQEEELVDQYYLAYSEDYSVEYGGKTYTQTETDEAWYSYAISDEAYDDIALLLAQAQNDAMAETYIQLVENRKTQAAVYGYEDTAEYYDDFYYGRDLSERNREELYEAVKAYIVPLLPLLDNRSYVLSNRTPYVDFVYTQEELLDLAGTALEKISPELTEALDYMREFGYYDMEYSENKVEGAFTTILYYPNAPYLLMNPTDSSYDFTMLIHEYGHYNAYYCAEEPMTYNLDLAEIHSQGLELLMLPQYDEVFGEMSELEELYTIYDILVALVDGCMFDELERFAYNQENLTVEDMNRRYMELLKEYGYRDADDPEELAFGWVMTSHLYDYPLYYLSYATSATAALGIWEMSLADYEGAVETYLELVALGESGTFFGTLRKVGLGNSLSEKNVISLASSVRTYFGFSGLDVPEDTFPMVIVYVLFGVLLLWITAAVIVMIFVVKKERKRREQFRAYLYPGSAGAAWQGPEGNWYRGNPAPAAGGEAGGREGGAAADLPQAGDEAVRVPETDEAAGPEC